MDHMKVCISSQDFEANVGHEAIWCPHIVCQKCEQKGHTKKECMSGHEDLKTLPNEILIKIIGYVCDEAYSSVKYPTTFDDLDELAKVSKRFQEICDTQKKILIDKVMKVQEVTLQSLPMLISAWRISCPNTEKVKEHVRTVLFANSKLTSTLIKQRGENLNQQEQKKQNKERIQDTHQQIQQFQQQQPQNYFPYLQSQQEMFLKIMLSYEESIQNLHQRIQQFQQQQPLNLFTPFRLEMHEFHLKDLQHYQKYQQKMQKHEQHLHVAKNLAISQSISQSISYYCEL